MVDNTSTKTVGEGQRVASVVVGAAIFYVGLVIIAVVTDWALPWLTNSDGGISILYIVAWVLGSGLVSALGAEAATRIAPSFNRVGLIVLMVAPVAILAVVMFFASRLFSWQTMTAVIFSFIGTGIGLSRTFNDMAAKRTNS